MPHADPPGPPAGPPPIISTTGLSRNFDDVVAVRDLGLSVDPGEMFGLVGPDGAGKSTIIRMLCGILTPGSGTGTILGHDIVKDRAALKHDLGYLSQKFTLYGDLSVDENIEFFAELHRVFDFAALRDQLLEFTQLKPFRDRLADRLSGGMKQKLALICTLIHQPKILFLDEPTTGVDPVSRRELWGLLQKLNADGMTVILCTPYMDEAERCARVAFIHQGTILRVDTPGNLRRLIPGRMVEFVCGDAGKAFSVLAARGGYPQAQVYGDRLKVIVDRDGDADDVHRILLEGSIGIASRRFVKPSLEDVFIFLLKETPVQ